jgi:hypothetical protein
MIKEFIPYEQALELKELGFKGWCLGLYPREQDEEFTPTLGYVSGISAEVRFEQSEFQTLAPLYQQAFRWFREKHGFTYSIGRTNIAVIHYGLTTQLLQNNNSYEEAELACIKKFIEIANAE